MACEFYSTFFGKSLSNVDYNKLYDQYEKIYEDAISLGLFMEGGIKEKDHLNFWCLGYVLEPEIYIESGVFIGTSMHAFIKSPNIKKTVGIDPYLDLLKVPKEDIPGCILIDDKDFSQIKFDHEEKESLVYFDDHINTADRIIQAYDNNFRYVLFDDSTGFEGVCQRLYPAIPTVPMIMNCELLSPGDELSWSFQSESIDSTRVLLSISQGFIDKCLLSKKLIKQFVKTPDLGEFLPQSIPEKVVDTSKYLVELELNDSDG
ncbi:MAG: hypothetical protein HKP62_03980 [Sulfurovum sp.]|nr:hypothetical protein [Sulfurovum sp.]